MTKRLFPRIIRWIERYRFQLLLAATIIVLILPAFIAGWFLSELVFILSMNFLFIQSMIAATYRKRRKGWLLYLVIFLMVFITWYDFSTPMMIESSIAKLVLLSLFFLFIIVALFRFIIRSRRVNLDVILAAINIYLLIGIASGSLAYLFYHIYPAAFNFPVNAGEPAFTTFIYFSFITMATVGYGDIVPGIPETQTLAYLVAITGQLYVAIIIAFLVGKYMVHSGSQ